MGNLKNRLVALGLPTEQLETPTTLYRASTGTHHFTHRYRSNKTSCGRKETGLTEVAVTVLDEVKVCAHCANRTTTRFAEPWPDTQVGFLTSIYRRVLKLEDDVHAFAEMVDAGTMTPTSRQTLAEIARIWNAPTPDVVRAVRLPYMESVGDADVIADVVRDIAVRAGEVLASLTDTSSIVDEACRVAAVEYTAAAAGIGEIELPSIPAWLGVGKTAIVDFWKQQWLTFGKADRRAFTLWLARSENLRQEGRGVYMGPGMLDLSRIPDSDCVLDHRSFKSPMDWARAEYKAAWERVVNGSIQALETAQNALAADRTEAIALVALRSKPEADSPIGRALASGREVAYQQHEGWNVYAIACPRVCALAAACDVPRGGRGIGDVFDRSEMSDELATTVVGLFSTLRHGGTLTELVELSRAVLA